MEILNPVIPTSSLLHNICDAMLRFVHCLCKGAIIAELTSRRVNIACGYTRIALFVSFREYVYFEIIYMSFLWVFYNETTCVCRTRQFLYDYSL